MEVRIVDNIVQVGVSEDGFPIEEYQTQMEISFKGEKKTFTPPISVYSSSQGFIFRNYGSEVVDVNIPTRGAVIWNELAAIWDSVRRWKQLPVKVIPNGQYSTSWFDVIQIYDPLTHIVHWYHSRWGTVKVGSNFNFDMAPMEGGVLYSEGKTLYHNGNPIRTFDGFNPFYAGEICHFRYVQELPSSATTLIEKLNARIPRTKTLLVVNGETLPVTIDGKNHNSIFLKYKGKDRVVRYV